MAMVMAAKGQERARNLAKTVVNAQRGRKGGDGGDSSDSEPEEPVEEVRRYVAAFIRYKRPAGSARRIPSKDGGPAARSQTAAPESPKRATEAAIPMGQMAPAVPSHEGSATDESASHDTGTPEPDGRAEDALLWQHLAYQGFILRPQDDGPLVRGAGGHVRRRPANREQRNNILKELSDCVGRQVDHGIPTLPGAALGASPSIGVESEDRRLNEAMKEASRQMIQVTVRPDELQKVVKGSPRSRVQQMGSERLKHFIGATAQRRADVLLRRQAQPRKMVNGRAT